MTEAQATFPKACVRRAQCFLARSGLLWPSLVWLCLLTNANAQTRLIPQILEQAEHDPAIFTQGLILHEGKFFASSGLYGQSFVRRYDAESNATEQQVAIPKQWFAEGLTLLDQRLFLLTWKAGVALQLDPTTLATQKQFRYPGEGWGLTHNGRELIMSDGSSSLFFHDPANFTRLRAIEVHNAWRKYDKLNELEFAAGAIWANVWQANIVLKIDPQDGKVLGIASLQELAKKHDHLPGHTVLNGIAWDAQREAFWITGKLWPKRYLVRFIDEKTSPATPPP